MTLGEGLPMDVSWNPSVMRCEQGRETALPCFTLLCLALRCFAPARASRVDDVVVVVVVIVYWTIMKQADGGPQQLTASNAIVCETSIEHLQGRCDTCAPFWK